MKQGMSSDDSAWTLNYKTSTNSLGNCPQRVTWGFPRPGHPTRSSPSENDVASAWTTVRVRKLDVGVKRSWNTETSSKCTQNFGEKHKWNIVKHSDANLLPTKCSLRWSQRVMYPSSLWMLSRAVHLLRSLTWHLPHANASDEDNWIDSAYRTTCNLQKQPIKWLLLWGWFQIMEKNLSFLLDASCSRYDSQKIQKHTLKIFPMWIQCGKRFLKKRVKIHWMCFLLAEFCCGKRRQQPLSPADQRWDHKLFTARSNSSWVLQLKEIGWT